MNVTSCEKKDKKQAELTIVVSPEEFEVAVNESYKKNKGRIAVPGFRKGKAPRKIMENMYGAAVFYDDALDIILPSVCRQGVTESNLKSVGHPSISDVSFGDDKSVTVTYTIDLYPEIELSQYKGLSAVKQSAVVDDSSVESEMAAVQSRNARIQTVDRPAGDGDTAVINFEGFVDGVPFEGGKGENYELVLGSNTFIPGFEEKIIGMTVGEDHDLDLVFPDEYHEGLAGKPVIFKVKLNEIKEKILPELDDEFAKDVSEFDTFAEYKNSIKEKLSAAKVEESEKAFEDAVLNKLAEGAACEIPDSMIEEFVDNQVENFKRQLTSYGMELDSYLGMMGTDINGFRASMRPNAERQVTITLALEKVAEIENIQPTEAEIDEYLNEIATKYGVEIAVVKETLPVDSVKRDIVLKAAVKLVCEAANAEEPAESSDEAASPVKEKKARKTKTAEKAAQSNAKSDDAATDDAAAVEKKPAAKKSAAKKPAAKKPAAKKAAPKTSGDNE